MIHILTVGWSRDLVSRLWNAIAAASDQRFSHILHPSHVERECSKGALPGTYFFREHTQLEMPRPDRGLLASLEGDGIPTVHNMVMGDRILAKLPYEEALSYATFLARRLRVLYEQIDPSVIVGSFDAMHSGMALAVARAMGIPWLVMSFSVIPPGFACFCDRLAPGARIRMQGMRADESLTLARTILQEFEKGRIHAAAYIAPQPLSFLGKIGQLPARIGALRRVLCNARLRRFLQFTEPRPHYSVRAAIAHLRRMGSARRALSRIRTLDSPPAAPYVIFALHMQPESSIDVWAPFFANQMWVVELLARSLPPSHRLLVKIHKSDVSNYTRAQLECMQALPGVQIVAPFADTRAFIERADLIVAIQGTIGLEAALLGKPVVMLGDSAFAIFPNVSRVGQLEELPALLRSKLAQGPTGRDDILRAYAAYLQPLMAASLNDWTVEVTAEQVSGYVKLFSALEQHLAGLSA